MGVLLDTNVVLDALLKRAPFVQEARAIFQKAEAGEIRAFVGATTVTTIDYLAARALGRRDARKLLALILELCEVAPVTRAVIVDAISSPIADFEDAVLCHAAIQSNVGTIITRNAKDFKGSGLDVLTPREWLATQA